jgi:hypothetical protein
MQMFIMQLVKSIFFHNDVACDLDRITACFMYYIFFEHLYVYLESPYVRQNIDLNYICPFLIK